MNNLKGKIGLMASSFLMMSFLAPTSVLADIAMAFPDVSLQTVQMITSIPCLLGVISALLVGKMTPYFYKRHLIISATLFYLLGGALPAFFHQTIWHILFGAGLLGIGLGIMLTCVAALICECCDERESGVLIGFQAAFISGGGMVFTWLGGQLGKTQWENAFFAYVLAILILVIDILWLPLGKLEVKKDTSGKKERVPLRVWFYALAGFLVYLFITVYNSNISMLVGIREFGGSVEASYASMCYTFAGMIAGCVSGYLIPKLKEYTFVLSTLMAAVGMLLAFLSGHLLVLCAGGLFCGAAFSSFTPAGNYFAAQKAEQNNRSFCIAIFTSISNLGQAVSPLMIAWIMKPLSISQRFLGMMAAFVLITVLVLFGIRSKGSVLKRDCNASV